jgi:hypothetical protein
MQLRVGLMLLEFSDSLFIKYHHVSILCHLNASRRNVLPRSAHNKQAKSGGEYSEVAHTILHFDYADFDSRNREFVASSVQSGHAVLPRVYDKRLLCGSYFRSWSVLRYYRRPCADLLQQIRC